MREFPRFIVFILLVLTLVQHVQVFAGFEAHRPARSNRNLRAGTRISSDAGLAWTHGKDSKTAQLDPLAVSQRSLQAFKYSVHGMLSLIPWQSGTFHHFVNNVLFDQSRTSKLDCPPDTMLGISQTIVNALSLP